jgi:hypothetical protein
VVIVQAVLAAQQQKIRHDSLMKTNGEQENECGRQSRHEAGKHAEVIENDAFYEQPKGKLPPSTKVSNLARESALAKETSELWPG